MAEKAIIILAEGFEEIEALTPADILQRAGLSVELVGLTDEPVTGGHGFCVQVDRALRDTEDVQAIILPGGLGGAENLSQSERVVANARRQLESGRILGAICAAPGLVLGRHGLLNGRRATCYPGFEKHFGPEASFVEQEVVEDGNLITSRGPGTAFAFGLALVRALLDDETADALAERMMFAGR